MPRNLQLNIVKQKWKELENEPGVFKYNLNVLNRKCLPGKHTFHAELNPDRTQLRRIPQTIPSLFSKFNPDKFNFTKIKPSEKLIDIIFEECVVSFIVNQSPLTNYHSLICPDLEKSQPQLITEKALHFCVDFLLSIDETGVQIGYNSPGALASVNHLHLHLMFIDYDLYIDNAVLEPIGQSNTSTYRLHSSMPTEAVCYIIDRSNILSIVKRVYELVQFMCDKNIPHNIFITQDKTQQVKKLKLFIYAREKHSNVKDLTELNVAFCEFSGYVPVGNTELYNSLTEDKVIEKITNETGNVYSLLYKYLNEL